MNRPLLAVFVSLAAGFGFRGSAQIPTWSVVKTGLDATLGNAGKGVLDPQVGGITGIAFGNGVFVIVGQSTRENVIRWATSPDGATWTAHSQALPANYQTSGQSGIHYLNGKFIFFATHSNAGFPEQWVYSSADAATFNSAKVANGRPGYVEFDASPTLTVVAGANGGQEISSDLSAWTAGPVVPEGSGYDHLDIAYGAGRFISSINGFGGAFYTSTDGSHWTSIANLAAPGGGFVEFGNGFFLAQSNGNKFKSPDGLTFTQLTPTISTAGWIGIGGDLRYAGGRFLATSTELSTFKNGFIASTDGVTWTPICYLPTAPAVPVGQSRAYYPLNLVFGNGKYILAANDIQQTAFSKTTLPILIVGDASAAPTPPTITSQPAAANAVIGGSATFSVSVPGAGLTYQWYLDSVAIAGATAASYSLAHVAASDAGAYTVAVTNAAGTTLSAAATLTLVSPSDTGRIINLSVRSTAGVDAQTLIVGLVIGGSGTAGAKPALIRAAGPALVGYGVSGTLADPVLTLYQGTTALVSNDDWSGDAQVTAASAQVGAFSFVNVSGKDAALYSAATAPGVYTVQVTGKNSTTGIALAEIYDASAASSFTATTPRLINVSARTQVGIGDGILIAGFVISGSTPCKVLIRGVGPTLANYGVTGSLADPKLELFHGSTSIATNDNWGGTAELGAAFTATGAFGLDAASKDAALLVTLSPGVYSAQVSGVGGTTGVALVEVYEAP